MKHSIRFASGGGWCAGDLHLPDREEGDAGKAPPPVVIMAHGIGAERSFGLEPFARAFTDRGLAALTFDYRHFGESSGAPRYLVSPPRQVEDYLAAAHFVQADERVDGSRHAFWGTSFSGGHVLVAAARVGARADSRADAGADSHWETSPPDEKSGLRAVVSQIPFVSGLSSTFVYPLRYQLPAVALGVLDRLGSMLGREPLEVSVVRKKGLALLASPDAFEGYGRLVPPDTDWPNRLPARVFLAVLGYRPLSSAAEVRVPTLMVAASNDAICPVSAARRAARRMPDCRLEEFPIGHFDAYEGAWFERISALEADFLQEKLASSNREERATVQQP